MQILQGKPSPELLQSIAEDVSRLPQHVRDAAAKQASVRLALSQDLAQAVPGQLTKMIADLAGEMKNKRRTEGSFIKIDLPDFIAGKGYLMIGPGGQPVHVEEYRKRVEQRILGVADQHPALTAIRAGREPAEGDLVADLIEIAHRLRAFTVQAADREADFLQAAKDLVDLPRDD